MDGRARAEIEARLRHAKGCAAATRTKLPTAANRSMGVMALNSCLGALAYNAVLLGRRDEAQEAFRGVAGCLVELAGPDLVGATGAYRRGLLEFTLLSGDADLEARLRSVSLAPSYPDLLPIADGYLRGLQGLVAGDDSAARSAAEALRALPPDAAKKGKYYPGLGDVVAALVERSDARLRPALEAVLDAHVAAARKGHLKGLESGYLCVPATCLALLARRRGLTPAVDTRFSRVPLKMRMTGLTEWEGQPTKDLFVEVEADVLPMDLVS